MTLQHVVVGVDGSLAVRALDRAAEEAYGVAPYCVSCTRCRSRRGRAGSGLVHRPDPRRHSGLRVVTAAVQGGPVEALTGEGGDAALTVVGTRGLNAVSGLVFGR